MRGPWLSRALMWLVGLAGAGALQIAGREYSETLLLQEGAQGHLVQRENPAAPANSSLLFSAYADDRLLRLRAGAVEPDTVAGLPHTEVYDVLRAPSGEVWLATAHGLLQYSEANGSVINPGITSNKICNLAVSPNGSLYVSTASGGMFLVAGGTLLAVPQLRVLLMAVSFKALHYTTAWNSPVYSSLGGPDWEARQLKGLPAGYVSLLDVDRRDDLLYVCHTAGLYYVPAGDAQATRVDGLRAAVTAVGFSLRGDIYLGSNSHVWKMTFISSRSKHAKAPEPLQLEGVSGRNTTGNSSASARVRSDDSNKHIQ